MGEKIPRSIARQILEDAKGTFFGVIFEKKDGTRREMQACIPRPKPNAKRPNPAFYNPDLVLALDISCLLYTSPSPRDRTRSRMPSSA